MGQNGADKKGRWRKIFFFEKLLDGNKPFGKRFSKICLKILVSYRFRGIGILGILNLLRGAPLCPRGALRCIREGSKRFHEAPKGFGGATKCIQGVPNSFSEASNFLRGASLRPHEALKCLSDASKWFRVARM